MLAKDPARALSGWASALAELAVPRWRAGWLLATGDGADGCGTLHRLRWQWTVHKSSVWLVADQLASPPVTVHAATLRSLPCAQQCEDIDLPARVELARWVPISRCLADGSSVATSRHRGERRPIWRSWRSAVALRDS